MLIVIGAILLIVLMGLLFVSFEKVLNHRTEMAKLRLQAKSAEVTQVEDELNSLRTELRTLRERLDEQAILIDDIRSIEPQLRQRVHS